MRVYKKMWFLDLMENAIFFLLKDSYKVSLEACLFTHLKFPSKMFIWKVAYSSFFIFWLNHLHLINLGQPTGFQIFFTKIKKPLMNYFDVSQHKFSSPSSKWTKEKQSHCTKFVVLFVRKNYEKYPRCL